MNDSSEKWWASVEAALAVGKQIAHSSDQFDQTCEHIIQLLLDSSSRLDGGSYATAGQKKGTGYFYCLQERIVRKILTVTVALFICGQSFASEPQKTTITKNRTLHMYSEMCHASGCVLKAGLAEPRGSTWQFLSSTVLTAFSFEAYLNHVGPTVFDCWEQLERLPPWSKFELLCETLGVNFTKSQGKRPLQTIVELLEFRNTMAHGRSIEIKPKTELRDLNDKLDTYLGELPLAHWERLVKTADFAQRAREDVQEILEILHTARPDPKEGLFTFGIGIHSARIA